MSLKRFFDLETTGFIDKTTRPHTCPQIIQYAIVTWQDGRLVDVQQRFVQPLIPVEDQAAKVNGYTPEYWDYRQASPFNQTDVALFHSLFNRQIVGGHNVLGFDLPILEAECNRLGFAAPDHDYHVVDTMPLGQILKDLGLSPSGKLADIVAARDLQTLMPVWAYPDRQRPHDAVFDACGAAEIYNEFLRRVQI